MPAQSAPARTRRYQNFDLLIEPAATGYRARVLDSPVGQATNHFTLPFDPKADPEQARLLRGRLRHIEAGPAEADPAVTPLDPQTLGDQLFRALFSGEVGISLRRSLDLAREQDANLRIRLRLDETPELAALPWEYLYDATHNRFLVLSGATPIVRYLALPLAAPPLSVPAPLRLLVMMADAQDVWPRLDVAAERKRLEAALQGLVARGELEITWLEQATLRALQGALRKTDYHLFHFIGHGWFDAATQRHGLLLENEQGQGEQVETARLAVLLHNHPTLRLAFLNACEGARFAEGEPLAGVAQELVQQGLPAVIAMQFPISDQAAITLAQEFYGALADRYPVDGALTEARTAIFSQNRGVEWGTPVLFLRAPDGYLWQTFQNKSSNEHQEQKKSILERRVDAAVQSNAKLGERIDVLVQLRLPSSPLLGIKDWPMLHRIPASIELSSNSVGLDFPIDRDTGKLTSIRLKVKCQTADFQIEGTDQEIIEVSPYEESKLLIFSLRANKKIDVGRINIRIYRFDDLFLGVIPLETVISDTVIPPSGLVANLSITVFISPHASFHPEETMSKPDQPPHSIHTGGGAYIGGNVNVGSEFVGRDKIVHGDEVKGDKVMGDQVQGHKASGDVIIATVGAGAKNVAVGKNIQQIINELGAPTPDDKQAIEKHFAHLFALLNTAPLDPRKAGRAESDLETLKAELTKTDPNEIPSASTITRIGDWLLNNVPEIAQAVTELFGLPAVGRVLGKAGDAAVAWWKARFGTTT